MQEVNVYRYRDGNDAPLLEEIGPGAWTLEAPGFVYFRPPVQPQMPYPHRSVLLRLNDQNLMVISPIALSEAVKQTVDEIGSLRHIVSPNAIHHLYMGEWQAAWPEARMHASPGLPAKRADLTFDTTLTSTPESDWSGQVDQCIFGEAGFLPEVVFHHRASGTLVLTDLVMDFDPAILTPLTRVTSRINRMYMHTPRGVQLANNAGREASRRVLETIRQWSPEHLVIAHSPWICVDGADHVAAILDHAFDWLAARPEPFETLSRGLRSGAALAIWPLHRLLSRVLSEPADPSAGSADQR